MCVEQAAAAEAAGLKGLVQELSESLRAEGLRFAEAKAEAEAERAAAGALRVAMEREREAEQERLREVATSTA